MRCKRCRNADKETLAPFVLKCVHRDDDGIKLLQAAKKAASAKATGGHAELDGGVTVLPRAGAAAAKGRHKVAPAGDGMKTVPANAVRAANVAHVLTLEVPALPAELRQIVWLIHSCGCLERVQCSLSLAPHTRRRGCHTHQVQSYRHDGLPLTEAMLMHIRYSMLQHTQRAEVMHKQPCEGTRRTASPSRPRTRRSLGSQQEASLLPGLPQTSPRPKARHCAGYSQFKSVS